MPSFSAFGIDARRQQDSSVPTDERLVQPRAYGGSVAVRTATEMFSLILVFFYLHLDVSGRLFLLL